MDWGLKLQLQNSSFPKEVSLVNQKLALLRSIAAQGAGCFIRSSAIRQEPEFLLINGPSRMGKTTLLPLASILIAQGMAARGYKGWLPKGTIEAGDIFHTKGESKFWEGTSRK
jgi:RecA-family ATPase